jgi:hypothetical protein
MRERSGNAQKEKHKEGKKIIREEERKIPRK